MSLKVRVEHPLSPSSRELIEASQKSLEDVYSAEECFSYSAEELDIPNSMFFVARVNGVPLGCVALIDEGTYGEVKRLYVAPQARGTGMARALMDELEQTAKDIGLRRIKLETGDKLKAAVELYRALGFDDCEKFGPYDENPASLFLEKPLALLVN